jgi:hypothetical protein
VLEYSSVSKYRFLFSERVLEALPNPLPDEAP